MCFKGEKSRSSRVSVQPVINIAAQVIILISVHDIHRVNRWLVAFGVGILITAIAVIAELKREQLRRYSRQVSELLETWE